MANDLSRLCIIGSARSQPTTRKHEAGMELDKKIDFFIPSKMVLMREKNPETVLLRKCRKFMCNAGMFQRAFLGSKINEA